MSKQTIIKCDICQSQEDVENERMQMLRNFDCTDGRTFYKHLVYESVDICKLCLEANIKSGKYLVDERVQGYGNIVLQD